MDHLLANILPSDLAGTPALVGECRLPLHCVPAEGRRGQTGVRPVLFTTAALLSSLTPL